MSHTTLADLVADPYAKKSYLAIINPYKISSTTITPFYYSDSGFVTTPTDTPANIYFDARLIEPLGFSRSMFSSNKLGGESTASFGSIVLTNNDGGLDGLATDYAFDGREIEIKVGEAGASYSHHFTIFKGSMRSLEFDDALLTIQMRDKQDIFEKDLQTTLYAGSGGTEGTSNIKNTPKPLLFGECKNVRPVLVDPTNFIYQVHTGAIQDIVTVYDGALVLSSGVTKDLTNGRFTLSTEPTNEVTCDVQGAKNGSGTYLYKAADIIDYIIQTYGGISSSDIDSASISALNTANANKIGIYIDYITPINEVLDLIADTVGAFYGFDRESDFEIARVDLPSGTAALELDSTNILEIERLSSALPNYRIRVGYSRNFTAMNESDLSATATTAQRDFVTRDMLYEKDDTAATLVSYPLSKEMVVESLFLEVAAATAEATRLLSIYDTQRDVYRVKLKTQPYSIKLNSVVNITFSRYNLTAGKLFRCVGMSEDATVNEVTLDLWG